MPTTQPHTRLRRLLKTLEGASKVLILPHNNPDPDAVASAVALRHLLGQALGLESQIAYRGIVGRAENRALSRYLDHPLEPLRMAVLHNASHTILVDTQPSFGNNPISPADRVTAVIDHHQPMEAPIEADFVDVRTEVGSSSTMLVEYLHAAKLAIPQQLATALLYGIKTDTMGLQRGASPNDHKAFCHLLEFTDFEAIGRIERAQVSPEYFSTLVETLQSTLVYDHIITSHIPSMSYPDLTADIADLLLRTRNYRWAFCSGIYKDAIYFSIRTENRRGAGEIARTIVNHEGTAGGHGAMGGGQLPLGDSEPEALALNLRREFLKNLSISPKQKGIPFL